MVRNVLSVVANGQWPTLNECIPPGSVLDLIDSAFYKQTDIPRELPFFTVLHYLSAMLLQQGVEIEFAGQRVLPDFWTIALAPSGAGKTFTQSIIAKALGGTVRLFPESASAAMFVESLASNNKGLWLRDEFAQYLNQVNTQSHMAQVKDYLLRAYDYTTIEHRTKKETFVIEKPALTIFGTTPLATIKNYLTAGPMGNILQPSPEQQATELLQVDIDAMWDVEELVAYKEKLKDCIRQLVTSVLDRRPNISLLAIANIDRLRLRVEARLGHVLEVIDRLREEAAEQADEPEAPGKAGAAYAPKL